MDKRKKHIMTKRPIVRPGLDHDRTPHERSKPNSGDILQAQRHTYFGRKVKPRRPFAKGIKSRFGS